MEYVASDLEGTLTAGEVWRGIGAYLSTHGRKNNYRLFLATHNPGAILVKLGVLQKQTYKSVWMIDPGVKVDPGYSVYQAGGAQGVWVQTAAGGDFQGGVWPGPCAFPDFTRPETWHVELKGKFQAGFGPAAALPRRRYHVPFIVMTAGSASEFVLRHGEPGSPERGGGRLTPSGRTSADKFISKLLLKAAVAARAPGGLRMDCRMR